ncbi:sensor histidine kinase [Mycolicibacterium baixiangningiae]|uniref:sensor histidine kinase n=1 Tax=Mycolicibacterium baixiangningiae TaxID=2761578 RepID=UPI0018679343|nr:sensor histidine kinase [Mycolicibacterium baixiangningiae]
MTAPARRRGRQLTVQGWLNVVLAVMGVFVLAGAFAGAVLMNRTDAVSRELIDKIQPSRVAAYRLQAAIRDQETAVRGFAIAADDQFLEPYRQGQQTEREAAAEIREHVGDHANLIADLDAVERATAEWRANYAEPFIQTVRPGRPGVVDNTMVQRGKEGFDNIRALFHVQNVDLAAARTAGVKELDQVRNWRDRALAGIIVTFFLTALVLAILARSALVRPLSALAASCRRITEGHFDERIDSRGPLDIRVMASDVEDMRQRIVDELEASREAREQLDEQAIELRRSNAELEQFAYVASHDLQEPLRKVASFCQLLEKRYGDKLDDRGAEYIKYAVDGAKRMQVLINDLLTFSRVGRLSAAHTDVELDEVLDSALSNLETSIEESGAEIVRPSEPLPLVTGDATLLAMLWQNLIGNAVKFRKPDTSPRIVIECQRGTDEQDGQWLLTVSDNGIGIAEEFAQKVFVIFQRLHGRDAYSGTGIGLALCKKIVEYHGGEIWIDNSYTEGTRFRMTLPVAVHEQPEVVLEGAQQ